MHQGGETWDTATLRGLGDTAPDCEGSMISANIRGQSCFFVSSPWSANRANLTVQSSCGANAPSEWSAPIVVDHQSSSYSSLAYTPSGKLLDLYSAYHTSRFPRYIISFFWTLLSEVAQLTPFAGSQCARASSRAFVLRTCRSPALLADGVLLFSLDAIQIFC